eukprot:651065-Prorocentrum_minimum.AAC.1
MAARWSAPGGSSASCRSKRPGSLSAGCSLLAAAPVARKATRCLAARRRSASSRSPSTSATAATASAAPVGSGPDARERWIQAREGWIQAWEGYFGQVKKPKGPQHRLQTANRGASVLQYIKGRGRGGFKCRRGGIKHLQGVQAGARRGHPALSAPAPRSAPYAFLVRLVFTAYTCGFTVILVQFWSILIIRSVRGRVEARASLSAASRASRTGDPLSVNSLHFWSQAYTFGHSIGWGHAPPCAPPPERRARTTHFRSQYFTFAPPPARRAQQWAAALPASGSALVWCAHGSWGPPSARAPGPAPSSSCRTPSARFGGGSEGVRGGQKGSEGI